MKKIIFLILIAFGLNASAQVRGTYGTLQPYTVLTGSIYNNFMQSRSADTLKGVDTAYVYFTVANPYKHQLTLQTIGKAASTLTATAVLQAWAGPNTGWVTRTGYWQSYVGDTSKCTTCVGSRKVISAVSGTNRYTWDIGPSTPTFANFRLMIIGTASTDTNAVTGFDYYSY